MGSDIKPEYVLLKCCIFVLTKFEFIYFLLLIIFKSQLFEKLYSVRNIFIDKGPPAGATSILSPEIFLRWISKTYDMCLGFFSTVLCLWLINFRELGDGC